jgi:hypothetical protein
MSNLEVRIVKMFAKIAENVVKIAENVVKMFVKML